MSLVGTLRRFIGTRAASTVTAAQATPAVPPTPEAAPSIEELRQRAKRVYKEVSRLIVDLSEEKMLRPAVEPLSFVATRRASGLESTLDITDISFTALDATTPTRTTTSTCASAGPSRVSTTVSYGAKRLRHSLRPPALRTGLDRAKIWRRPRLNSWHQRFRLRRLRRL